MKVCDCFLETGFWGGYTTGNCQPLNHTHTHTHAHAHAHIHTHILRLTSLPCVALTEPKSNYLHAGRCQTCKSPESKTAMSCSSASHMLWAGSALLCSALLCSALL